MVNPEAVAYTVACQASEEVTGLPHLGEAACNKAVWCQFLKNMYSGFGEKITQIHKGGVV
jgi:hypothetical protein